MGLQIDAVTRHEGCGDDESGSYAWVGYRQFIDSSWACLAL